MGGLLNVIAAATILRGEKSAPELPIPYSAIVQYSKDRRLSNAFAQLVWAYDTRIMAGIHKKLTKTRSDLERKSANVIK